MLVYRITHKNFSKQLYTPGNKGRWYEEGKKVICCAESIALAFLENMVRRQGVGFNDDFKIMIVEVPNHLKITSISTNKLEEGWRNINDFSKCQPWGNKWYDESQTLLLKVPSAVLPEAFNYVINTTHQGYKEITLVDTTDLVPDERIEEILKRYSEKQKSPGSRRLFQNR